MPRMNVRNIKASMPLTARFRLSEQLMMPWHPKHNVSTAKAAKLLGCSKPTVVQLIESGDLSAYKVRKEIPNSPYKISWESLQRFADKLREQTGRPEAYASLPLE
jgi:excisionase family DNA binding protein